MSCEKKFETKTQKRNVEQEDSTACPSSKKFMKVYTDEDFSYFEHSDDEFWTTGSSDNNDLFLISSESENSEDAEVMVQFFHPENFSVTTTGSNNQISTNLTFDQKSQTVRSDEKSVRNEISFTRQPSLNLNPDSMTPFDFFSLFANDRFFDFIIKETNDYAGLMISKTTSPRARIKSWKPLDRREFSKFLGLLFMTGQIVTPDIYHLWKKNIIYNFPTFSSQMSRDRFLLILSSLHFNKSLTSGETSTNPLYNIQPLLDCFEETMKSIHFPVQNLSLEERMVPWKGRIVFKRFMPNTKLYLLAEPDGLACKLHVYDGREDSEVIGEAHVEKIKKILKEYLDIEHSIFVDNLSTSISLIKCLLSSNTSVIEALKQNHKDDLEIFNNKVKKHEIIQKCSPEEIKGSNETNGIMISSKHDAEPEEVTENRKSRTKLSAIVSYNKTFVGMNKNDQFLAYCPVHNVSRWPSKVGILIFNLMLNNSFILYNRYNRGNMKLIDFRDSVIESLLGEEEIATPPPRLNIIHLPLKSEKSRLERKRCRVCHSKKVRKNTPYFCDNCPDKPGLCLEVCFREYHKY